MEASRTNLKLSLTEAAACMKGAASFFASSENRRLRMANASALGSFRMRLAAVSSAGLEAVMHFSDTRVDGASGSGW